MGGSQACEERKQTHGGTARLSIEHSSTTAPLPGTVHQQPIFARLVRL